MIKKFFLAVIFLIGFSVSFAQFSVPFKTRYEGTVKGDMISIANNIMNRVDYNNAANNPYYNRTNLSNSNDAFQMQYIDIDADESTFSSSSAELFYENPKNKKILYAGLYWSANYKYNSGIEKSENKFIADDPARESINTIKIKFPNQEEYIDIIGEIIFDGINDNDIKALAPYAVYADITDYVKKLPIPTGVYTVADIKATQGKLDGGVAAGWTIFVVYEDQNMNEKHIISKDGFATVNLQKPNQDIVFEDNKLTSNGPKKVKIAAAALEGDNNIIGDQLFFEYHDEKSFKALSNSIRKENNFFNSCISIDDEYFMNRFPDSKNTLGYDSFIYTIPNQYITLSSNSNQKAIVRLKTSGDNYFLFFAALSIEAQNNEEVKTVSTTTDEISNKNQIVKIVPANNDLLDDDNKSASTINRINKNSVIEKNTSIEIQKINSSTIASGYYLLARIAKTEQKTQEFVFYLKSKGITANYFTNPLNNYNYVYLEKASSQQEAIELYTSKFNNSYKEPLQILLVNNDYSPIISKTIPNEVAIAKEEKQKEIIPEIEKKQMKVVESNPPSLKTTEAKKEQVTKSSLAKTETFPTRTLTVNDIHVATIPNKEKGYYIIANVFSIDENSSKFIRQLESKGFAPKEMLNTSNNYRYIYLTKVDNEEDAKNLILSNFDNKYKSKLWILSVNN
ncbi:MAG: hypothetical protein WCJ62_01170 [Flavobacterium sp.]